MTAYRSFTRPGFLAGLLIIGLLAVCPPLLAADSPVTPPAGVLDYSQWFSFKIGSWCKHETVSMNNGTAGTLVETFTFTNMVEASHLLLHREATQTDAQGKTNTSDISMTLSPRPARPNTDDTKITEGDEDLTAAGQTIHTHFFKMLTVSGQNTWDRAIWISPLVPGGVVRQTSKITMNGTVVSTVSNTLTAFHAVQ